MTPNDSQQTLSKLEVRQLLCDLNLLVYETKVSSESLLKTPVILQTDSRKLNPGDWFLAYRGEVHDSHQFLTVELLAIAGGVIYEDPSWDEVLESNQKQGFRVRDARLTWAHIAAAQYGHPHKQLRMIGVTGTNGKTSTVWIIRNILEEAGQPCLSLGTLGAMFPEEIVDIGHTTPDPNQLFQLLARAVKQGIKTVVMEVSSHAIAQKRLGPIKFEGAAFTSFSRDHLDFHGTMEAYLAEKTKLVTELLKPGALAMIHQDVWNVIPDDSRQKIRNPVIYRNFKPQTFLEATKLHHVQFEILERNLEGTRIALRDKGQNRQGELQFVTDYGIANFVAALLLTESVLQVPFSQESWQRIKPVPGRMEPVHISSGQVPTVIVDYAHTPDALERTLDTLKPLVRGKLWVVFGCGGDRDRGKRPLMGHVAAQLADEIVITSDNPRKESPEQIIKEIEQGLASRRAQLIEIDRQKAINWSILKAAPDDVILIAGKGHETYQLIGNQKTEFDDRTVARDSLLQRASVKK